MNANSVLQHSWIGFCILYCVLNSIELQGAERGVDDVVERHTHVAVADRLDLGDAVLGADRIALREDIVE